MAKRSHAGGNQRRTSGAGAGGASDSMDSSKKRGRSPRMQLDAEDDDDNDKDDHLDSASSDDDDKNNESESEEEQEDLATKKVRLAREYLERIEADDDDNDQDGDDNDGDDDEKDDDEEEEEDRVARRLRDRRLEQTGMKHTERFEKISQRIHEMEQSVAKKGDAAASSPCAAWVSAGYIRLLRGHDLALTCVALQGGAAGGGAAAASASASPQKAISGSKDHSVLLWDVETSQKLSVVCPHWKHSSSSSSSSWSSAHRNKGQVLSVACSERYAAVGSRDAVVRIFDLRSPTSTSCVKVFAKLHKGPITALCFQTNTNQLFSGSDDRLIRNYNLDEMLALETLYGHQMGVTGLDCMTKELPVSVGRDRTARAWKLAEDTHMIYRGGSLATPPSCVSLVKEDWFITGHEDNGQVSLWSTDKKKPVATAFPETNTPDNKHSTNTPDRSIVSIAALKRSDLALTGASNGSLQTWRIRTASSKAEGRDITPGPSIPLQGYLNGIAIAPNGKFCIVATGNEHRMGRWNPISTAKNRLAIVSLMGETTPPQSNQQAS